LKLKTQEVEELSLKIDELFSINHSVETLMKKILRFDQDLFNQIKIQLETKNIE
jgi:hypothetical protein